MSYDPADFCDDVLARCAELGLIDPRSIPEGDLASRGALVIGALNALAAQLPSGAANADGDLHNCRRALWHLARAREALAMAGAPRSLERVRLAISSTKGAIRNAHNKLLRAQWMQPRPWSPAAPAGMPRARAVALVPSGQA